MKAFVLAAGLGTRLKPWTLSHPKALVEVGGVPMLKRVVENLKDQGAESITINVHHFASQILDFLKSENWDGEINVSDESDLLLDTGGAILKAERFLASDDSPILVHNVDILSNADLRELVEAHEGNGADITLLVCDRKSSRQLIFNPENLLRGWHNLSTDEYKPEGFTPFENQKEYAFSGIYVISPRMIGVMKEKGFSGKFSIIDFFLAVCREYKVMAYPSENLRLIDIGKPETLARAQSEYMTIRR